MERNRKQYIDFLLNNPYKFGRMIGFDKLTEVHNEWIKEMLAEKKDRTLQAHRGSYKTTCVSIAIALLLILRPNKRIMFMRKTDADIKEVVQQVQKILLSQQARYFVRKIYGVEMCMTTCNQNSISTNLNSDIKGTAQLVGLGIGGSLTGKHFDYIFTDDIVNINDRFSRAERERTKVVYQELRNIVNRGGRIYNTGTPWHKDDAFSLMPNAEKFDCYSTNLISDDELNEIKSHMMPSLFAANYELRHIASEDVIFASPKTNADAAMAEQGIAHIDAAYGGEDYTAFTILAKRGGKWYAYGRMWRKPIDTVEDEIIACKARFMAGRIICEDNGDKGFLAKELRSKGERVQTYHENMNKFQKITSYLKYVWDNLYFVEGTDAEYIEQVCDYNENAEHDDAPDGLASAVRAMWNKHDADDERKNALYLL